MLDAMKRAAELRLALAGLLALVREMGLGRFLNTPVLPMMIKGTVQVTGAALVGPLRGQQT